LEENGQAGRILYLALRHGKPAGYMIYLGGVNVSNKSVSHGVRLLAVLVVLGLWCCGCIEMSLKTKIEANGKCQESIQITTNAMFAEGIKSELKNKDLGKQGYKVETKSEGEKVHIIFSKDYASVDEMYKSKRLDPVSNVEGGDASNESKAKGEYKVKDYFFIKQMSFKEVTPKVDKPGGKPEDKQNDEMNKKFAQSLFSFKRIIQMPGPITSSNATSVDKATNTATWEIPFDKIQDGCAFEVASQVINIPAIVGAGVVLLVVIIAVIAVLTKKKPEAPAAPASSGPEAS
jgi:hypothetical protein